jgi:hypothetical protein
MFCYAVVLNFVFLIDGGREVEKRSALQSFIKLFQKYLLLYAIQILFYWCLEACMICPLFISWDTLYSLWESWCNCDIGVAIENNHFRCSTCSFVVNKIIYIQFIYIIYINIYQSYSACVLYVWMYLSVCPLLPWELAVSPQEGFTFCYSHALLLSQIVFESCQSCWSVREVLHCFILIQRLHFQFITYTLSYNPFIWCWRLI